MDDQGLTRRGLIGTAAAAGIAAGVPASAGAAARRRPRRIHDVIVVGAGLSGLTAARRLAKAGKSVLVVEARNRVGGRTLSRRIGEKGEVAELGAQFVGPTQNHVLALAREFGMATYDVYDEGVNVYYDQGTRSTFSDQSPLGPIPPDPQVVADIAPAVTLLDQMSTEVPVDAPWSAPRADEWDSQTFDTWVRQNVHTEGGRGVFDAAIEAIWGFEAREPSLLYVLFYIASAGDEQNVGTVERLFNTRGGAQQSRITGGTQGLSIRIAKELGRKHVALRHPVRRIVTHRRTVDVHTDRATFRARRVIVAVPTPLAGRITYDPIMPFMRDQLTQRMPMGAYFKCEAVYETPFWREDGLTGQAVSTVGPCKVTFDASPADGSPGLLIGFIGGDPAREWGQRSAADRREAVLKNFADYFGPRALDPVEYFDINWGEQEFSRGDPVPFAPPGVLLGYGEHLRRPVGRLHWAGTETADYWNGYLEGAMRSGLRAAGEVLAAPR